MDKKQGGTTDAVEILHRLLVAGDPEMEAILEQERLNLNVAQQIYDLRTQANLTQRQLAELVKTTPSVISRLEDADYNGHSVPMLIRIGLALCQKIEVRFVPGASQESSSLEHKKGTAGRAAAGRSERVKGRVLTKAEVLPGAGAVEQAQAIQPAGRSRKLKTGARAKAK
jgi:transcriptional regulator with XRE-family HTH domain